MRCQLLLELADDFVDSVVVLSSLVARHRQSKLVDVKDVQLTLQQHWGIRVPGFFSPDDVLAAVGGKGAAETASGGSGEGSGAQRDFSGGFEGLKGVKVLKRAAMTEGHRRRLQAVAAAKVSACNRTLHPLHLSVTALQSQRLTSRAVLCLSFLLLSMRHVPAARQEVMGRKFS